MAPNLRLQRTHAARFPCRRSPLSRKRLGNRLGDVCKTQSVRQFWMMNTSACSGLATSFKVERRCSCVSLGCFTSSWGSLRFPPSGTHLLLAAHLRHNSLATSSRGWEGCSRSEALCSPPSNFLPRGPLAVGDRARFAWSQPHSHASSCHMARLLASLPSLSLSGRAFARSSIPARRRLRLPNVRLQRTRSVGLRSPLRRKALNGFGEPRVSSEGG